MSSVRANPTQNQLSRASTIAVRITIGLLALLFIGFGIIILTLPTIAATSLEKWGYPDWVRIVVGIVTISGGFVLLVSRFAFYAAGLLGVVLAGAIFNQLAQGEEVQAVVALPLLVLVAIVAAARRPRVVTARRLRAVLDVFAEQEIINEQHRRAQKRVRVIRRHSQAPSRVGCVKANLHKPINTESSR